MRYGHRAGRTPHLGGHRPLSVRSSRVTAGDLFLAGGYGGNPSGVLTVMLGMKISLFIHNGYGIGGTITTTFNLAGALAARHDVEIVSVFRHREQPNLVLDPRVRLRALVDLRREKNDPRHLTPARVFPSSEYRFGQYSALTDERIAEALASIDADVVVGTRPGLNVHVALQAPARVVRVGQEHLTLNNHPPRLRNVLRRTYRRLDAVTTVTEADAAVYRRRMRLPGVQVRALPNSVPTPTLAPAGATSVWWSPLDGWCR